MCPIFWTDWCNTMLFHGQNTNYFGCRRSCFYLIYHVADVILVIWLHLSALTAWEKASMFFKVNSHFSTSLQGLTVSEPAQIPWGLKQTDYVRKSTGVNQSGILLLSLEEISHGFVKFLLDLESLKICIYHRSIQTVKGADQSNIWSVLLWLFILMRTSSRSFLRLRGFWYLAL